MEPVHFIRRHAARSVAVIERALADLDEAVAEAARSMIDCLERDGRILACGNGGSASDALHFSAELLNRYREDRRPLPAICLNADIATLTAIANDYRFDDVFAKQVDALGRPGDVLLAITTSGNSPNVVAAIEHAQAKGLVSVLLTGRDGGECAQRVGDGDVVLCVDDDATAHIQEAHGVIIHCLCALIEDHFINAGAPEDDA
jgi:D-sedoheptulose 7-phosphate isomerase